MSSKLTAVLISILLVMSPTFSGPLALTSSLFYCYNAYNNELNKQKEEELKEQQKQELIEQLEKDEYNRLHTYSKLRKNVLKEYANIFVAESHFTKDKDKTSDNNIVYNYLDGYSYVEIKFQSKLDDEALKNINTQICKLDNIVSEEKITCGELEFNKVISENSESSDIKLKRITWYTLKSDSVLIVDGYIAETTDSVPFTEAIETGLALTNIYYVSKIVFETPTTGYYAK